MNADTWSFDPYAPGFDRNPHPTLARLREDYPVYYWEPGRAWLLSRYADCAAALRDPRLGSDMSQWKHAPDVEPTELDATYDNGLFSMESDRHTRMRKLLSPSFTPRATARRRDEIRELVCEVLDSIDTRSEFDLAEELGAVIPIRVIARVLGIESGHEETFRNFAKAVISGINPLLRRGLPPVTFEHIRTGRKLLLDVIERRRHARGNDLLSELIAAEEDGDKLTTEELVTVVTSLVIAGAETTSHLINLGFLALLEHPESFERVHKDRSLLPNAIDEMLRYDLFGRLGSARYTLEPVEIQGTKIGAGEMLVPLLTAALRDPRRFPDPDRFDIDRDQRFNIAFGQGAHYCLGAALARTEAEVVFDELLTRYPRARLIDGPHFEFHTVLRNVVSIRLATGR